MREGTEETDFNISVDGIRGKEKTPNKKNMV